MKCFLALIIGLVPFCLSAQSGSIIRLNDIVARVNDALITYKEVRTAIDSDLEFIERRFAGQPALREQKERELWSEAVQQLVERQLILHEFKTGGYNLPESWIEDQIDKDVRDNYGDRLTLTRTLQARGLTFENYRQRVRERIIMEAMIGQFVPRNPVISPFKIETYYKENQEAFKLEDQIKLRMIVLANRPTDSSFSPRDMAQEIHSKLEEGAPFAEMAMIYSQGSQSVEGGDWGWIERSVLRSDLAEVAFSLAPGGHSDVVETPDGCYLMLVEEVKPAHTRPLSDVRDQIERILKDQEKARLRDRWIGRLKAKSFVQYFAE
jgi:peptidyl-prolyl cis-trans isomerase SurA